MIRYGGDEILTERLLPTADWHLGPPPVTDFVRMGCGVRCFGHSRARNHAFTRPSPAGKLALHGNADYGGEGRFPL